MKDGSKLFEHVSEETYAEAFERLQNMRKANPSYRDDQLLMRLLCYYISGEGQAQR